MTSRYAEQLIRHDFVRAELKLTTMLDNAARTTCGELSSVRAESRNGLLREIEFDIRLKLSWCINPAESRWHAPDLD
jgi:uncharacterized protein YlaN (UPF0358 family)